LINDVDCDGSVSDGVGDDGGDGHRNGDDDDGVDDKDGGDHSNGDDNGASDDDGDGGDGPSDDDEMVMPMMLVMVINRWLSITVSLINENFVKLSITPMTQRVACELCKGAAPADSPVVYADRAGYNKQWHPTCFVCIKCSEPLVDLIYFWKDGAPWCGRHYCESLRPRCSGCDEIIFSEDYQRVEDLAWHRKHFICEGCEQLLSGRAYIVTKGQLLCPTCSKSKRS
ncbi:hypothetical protein U0070_002875, partial [Myodes glareolus]